MRVTAEVKAATRARILETARRLFAEQTFEATTTRDIAQAAGIATGTLFNYFPTKDAIMACLASEAVAQATAGFGERGEQAETLEESLFALVAASLRKLKSLRRQLPALLETSLSPLAHQDEGEAVSFRTTHLEAAAGLMARHGLPDVSATALQLYWTLYTGVLVFWAHDKSPKQEDTLALLDQSINMFVGWLRGPESSPSELKSRSRKT